jgi:adenylate kinase family enzyme
MAEMAKRIVLLGCAGAGKSTLARRLGEQSGAAVICLDAIWRPEWADDIGPFRALMTKTHAGQAWISDGNFALATFDIRLPRADLIVWLDRPRLSCTWRAITRVFRPGEAHQRGDLIKALRFIWGFERINRPRIEAARLKHGAQVPVIHLRGDRDIEAFLLAYGGIALTDPPRARIH